MKRAFPYQLAKRSQYLASIATIVTVSLLSFFLSPLAGYKVVAYLLLLAVSLLALFCDIVPVLLAAALSAFIWDFFFIPPRFTVQVATTEDGFLLVMYFVVALLHATLTYKLKQMQRLAQQREEKAGMARLYSTLLNSLSHELRTPIATIVGATDNLLAANLQLSELSRASLLQEVSLAALRLNHQVENLLSMSRLESGAVRLKKDWCDLSELVYTTLARLEEESRQHVLEILIPEDIPLVRIDAGLMEQALYNLLANALQYTPASSIVTVNVLYEKASCEIVVEDNGPGFPESDLPLAFDKFYRLEGSRTGGTGLGLSIVQGYVEAHEGKIVLENAPLGGARFTITLPVETSELKAVTYE